MVQSAGSPIDCLGVGADSASITDHWACVGSQTLLSGSRKGLERFIHLLKHIDWVASRFLLLQTKLLRTFLYKSATHMYRRFSGAHSPSRTAELGGMCLTRQCQIDFQRAASSAPTAVREFPLFPAETATSFLPDQQVEDENSQCSRICISPITNEIVHIFKCSLAIQFSSLKYLFVSFT